MTPLEIKQERLLIESEYGALKSILASLLLENSEEDVKDDLAYYNRKFNEARRKLKGAK